MAIPKGTPRPCKGCGTTILKLKFCTNDCRVDWYARTASERERARSAAKGIRSWRERYPVQRTVNRKCEHCGEAFTRRQRVKDSVRFCSKRCAGAKRTADKAAKQRERPLLMCQMCGCQLERRRRLYCSQCAEARAKEQQLEWVASHRVIPKCHDCQVEVERYQRRCGPCAEVNAAQTKQRYRESPVHKASRRKAKAFRRAVERGVNAERFDPFEIFERDKWRCHLCGCKTPKRLRGTYEDNAPELDHVLPLAAGGEHTRRNTACSCRKCNGLKADKPLGQLRLVA